MILRQVREDEDAEAGSGKAALRPADRRRLHRAGTVARVEHLAQQPLQVDRLRRIEADRALLAPDDAPDVGEQRRPPPSRLEDGVKQERGRRLPVRPGHRRDLERVGRATEEFRGRRSHRLPHARDDELRDVEVVEPALDDERDGPTLDRLRREVVAVGRLPGDAEEERPRRDGARVVGQVGDLDPENAQIHRRDPSVRLAGAPRSPHGRSAGTRTRPGAASPPARTR